MNLDAFFTNKPHGVLLSSAIGDIQVYCQGECTELSVVDSQGVTLFSERLWADVNGCVMFCELSSLVEEYMRGTCRAFETFSVRTHSDSMQLQVLYCERFAVCRDLTAWLSENFLTLLTSRRVAPDAVLPLYLYAEEGESLALIFAATVRLPSGETELCDFSVDLDSKAKERGVVQLSVSVADVAAKAVSQFETGVCLGFTVHCGDRYMTCCISEELRGADVFYFRNQFNVWDLFSLPAVTVAKSEKDIALGVVDGTTRQYDRNVSKFYELETAALTFQEARWADSFTCSHEVVHLREGAVYPVIITECECPVSDHPKEPYRVEFTWRYASNRPVDVLELPTGIFTKQFNPVFS